MTVIETVARLLASRRIDREPETERTYVLTGAETFTLTVDRPTVLVIRTHPVRVRASRHLDKINTLRAERDRFRTERNELRRRLDLLEGDDW